ncbi:MAG: molybdenum cofactor biosynthesis protein MoaE [Bacteroidota bacterium]|nr:molybdenum cofactor biosynthesis protein MoaE [Bacteroidota bacterium]
MSKYFINGKIEPAFIGEQILMHQNKTDIGAHSIFLGQVRNDERDGKKVIKIIYTAYGEMAEKEISKIRELILKKYELKCLHVFHSIGEINSGEISIFVFGSMSHRKNLSEAIKETVDLIKTDVPIWKKEIFE